MSESSENEAEEKPQDLSVCGEGIQGSNGQMLYVPWTVRILAAPRSQRDGNRLCIGIVLTEQVLATTLDCIYRLPKKKKRQTSGKKTQK